MNLLQGFHICMSVPLNNKTLFHRKRMKIFADKIKLIIRGDLVISRNIFLFFKNLTQHNTLTRLQAYTPTNFH